MRAYRQIIALIAIVTLSLSLVHATLHNHLHHSHATEEISVCDCSCACECSCEPTHQHACQEPTHHGCESASHPCGCLASTEHEAAECQLETEYVAADREQQIKLFGVKFFGITSDRLTCYSAPAACIEYHPSDEDVGESCGYLHAFTLRGPPSMC